MVIYGVIIFSPGTAAASGTCEPNLKTHRPPSFPTKTT